MKATLKKLGSVFMALSLFLTMFTGMQVLDVTAGAINPPTSVSEITTRLNNVINGQYGDGVWSPFTSADYVYATPKATT